MERLESGLVATEQAGDLVTAAASIGSLALALFALGRKEAARKSAEQALRRLQSAPLIGHVGLTGVFNAAEVLLSTNSAEAARGLTLCRTFAARMPVGRASLSRLEALAALAHQRPARARKPRKHLEEGIEASGAMGLVPERALGEALLGALNGDVGLEVRGRQALERVGETMRLATLR